MTATLPDPLEVACGILAESMERPNMRVCPGCGGKGGRMEWTCGSRMPDPQTEEVCGECEGSGEVPR